MKANYHTHTYLCQHAYDTPRDYVENAVRAGMETLGFSDHVPYRFLNGYVSKCRMPLSEIDNYLSMILDLREEYKGRIEILIGYEVEYYRDEFAGMLEEIRARHCDFNIIFITSMTSTACTAAKRAPKTPPTALTFMQTAF